MKRVNSENERDPSLVRKRGWNLLQETVMKLSSNDNTKYDENVLIDRACSDLTSSNRFSFTLSSTGIIPPEELEVTKKILKICNLRDEFVKDFPDIDTPLVENTVKYGCNEKKDRNQLGSEEPIYNPSKVVILQKCNAFLNFVNGIFFVHWDPQSDQGPKSRDECCESNKLKGNQSIKLSEEYLASMQEIMIAVQDPACKSFCYQRLKYLEQKFDFHIMFNGSLELRETTNIKHRDFYNIRKVDAHVHHSACMQQKVLLRFIREKYNTEPDTIVHINEKGMKITLKEIFHDELKSSAYEVNVDSLAVHALGNCFHRFDLFNEKYNPFGQKILRDIFLKTDNYIEGRYLAEITQKEIKILEESKYQHVEWRISIYGRNKNEWIKLAKWVLHNELSSVRIRWIIQIPRLYHIYKKMKLIYSFEDFLRNIFEPCFDAIKNPEENKEIFTFLHLIVGWDSVDDESAISKYTMKGGELPTPDKYTSENNPPYSYYAYYMYVNIRTLNEFLTSRNLRPMAFRPHCGEIGNISHLATMYLLADRINHGINLRKSPVLLYLYYLKQIGLAVSPLSNNALFLQMEKNPFKRFFKIGLNVSLSTDDPLMFHFTDEPLLEEYSVCAHVWKLSTVDLCEIARNSVIQSGYEPSFKKHWLGSSTEDRSLNFQNTPEKTNIPNTRMAYRKKTLEEEMENIRKLANCPNPTNSTCYTNRLGHTSHINDT
ncbi:AMP deaminase, putative [Plasmodium ovale wallikeri]|uniref:AMP deaminase n=2 Tax=Plasmodium ovale TaxID=36330 RepID=A0A1A8ZBE0_PLAOA|nr:AMP deaminase, putative [Plasmodium ovale wallikeri]SBT41419.1 AMP deaminase, putative [Plasmodium ovale wallikeri]SBT78126.1 AMP deaminase, putative [Plasmodium ovale]